MLLLSDSKNQKKYKPMDNLFLYMEPATMIGNIKMKEMDIKETDKSYQPNKFHKFAKEGHETLTLPIEKQKNASSNYWINPFTLFFREELSQAVFENVVMSSYHNSHNLSVASVGCSTGKEAYSFILWNWNNRDRLMLDAYDINPKRISEAKKGIYDTWSESEEDLMDILEELKIPEKEQAYIIKKGETISFSADVKEKIRFSVHDIMKTKLPQKYDTVLLMNVLYHFPTEGIEKILLNVYDSLNENGFLLIERYNSRRNIEYIRLMNDLFHLGFEKQKNMLQETDLEDEMKNAQLYKKIS
jgi:chemotaxis methyl-accepting protein methylase